MACVLGGSRKNLVGYCRRHHCAVTAPQVRSRECLGKQCAHLKRWPHPFWEQREETKAKRKARKERLDAFASQYEH